MSLEYSGIPYFPLTANFFEEGVPELLEAKFGIRASYILIRLLSKIYKEGYYIVWGKEQCIIFLRKFGGEVNEEIMNGIIELLVEKEFFDKESYEKSGVLTSIGIQKVWMEATVRRKRDPAKMLYLLIPVTESKSKKGKRKGELSEENADILPTQPELNSENACNFRQTKLNKTKQEKTKQEETKASSSEEEEGMEGGGKSETPFVIPEYAYNTTTHNLNGLMDCLERHKITDPKERQTILRLSDYGRKGTTVWRLFPNTNWSKIEAPGRYIIAALSGRRGKETSKHLLI